MVATRSNNSTGLPKIVITTAESRTGDALMQEAERLASSGDHSFEICGIYPPTIQPLPTKFAKTAQIDVAAASVDELVNSFQGVDIAVLIPPATKTKVQIASKLTEACLKAGVPTMILVSDIRLNNIPEEPAVAMFGEIEEFAMQNGQGKSNLIIVRAGHYMQNLFLYAEQMLRDGYLGLPTGDGKMAPIDVRDVALIILRLASEADKHNGQVYNLSGVEALNGEEMMEVARQAGLPKETTGFRSISEEELIDLYKKIPAIDPSEGERNLVDFRFIREGGGDKVFPDAQKLSTVPPTTLLDFMKEYQGIFLGTST